MPTPAGPRTRERPCQRLVGAYAIAVIDHRQPGKVFAAREGSPLLLGVSETGHYAASDASALLQVTRNMIYLENGDIAELTAAAIKIARLDGTPVERPVHVSQLSAAAVELGNYQHYVAGAQAIVAPRGQGAPVKWERRGKSQDSCGQPSKIACSASVLRQTA